MKQLFKSTIIIIFLVPFQISCYEKKEAAKKESPKQQLSGTWVPVKINWTKLKDDTSVFFTETKSYFLIPDGSLTISEGMHYLKNDSITFKGNVKFYYGKWKSEKEKLYVEYKVNEGSGKIIIEELGVGKIIQLNGESYTKTDWEILNGIK